MADSTANPLDLKTLQTQLLALQNQVNELQYQIQRHVGPQPGASQPNTPHPTLINRTTAAQAGRFM